MDSSDETITYEPKAADSAIVYEFGLKFGLNQFIKQGSTTKKRVTFLHDQNDVYYGLFDESDVDFEIVVENNSDHDVSFGVKLVGTLLERQEFFVGKHDTLTLKALEAGGKHLHFVSQATDDGKLIVAKAAAEQNITPAQASIKCSRITMDFFIKRTEKEFFWSTLTEEQKREHELEEQRKKEREIEEENKRKLEVEERRKNSGSSQFMQHSGGRIRVTARRSGAPPRRQLATMAARLSAPATGGVSASFDEDEGEDEDGDNDIVADGVKEDEESRQTRHYAAQSGGSALFGSSGGLAFGSSGGAMNIPFGDVSAEPIGERGAVCFGRQTNQQFQYFDDYGNSEKYIVKGFTIEMRKKSG